MDSAVVEALKVINKAAIETGFPWIPTILESEKEGGAYLRRAFVWYYGLGVGAYTGEGAY